MLGVTFECDPHFKFNANVKSIVNLASPRIILKTLAGTNWGQQKKTILFIYKSLSIFAAYIKCELHIWEGTYR